MIYPAYGRDGRSARAEARPLLLFCRAIWQNDANRCSLPDHALRFHPAAVELRNMFYDG